MYCNLNIFITFCGVTDSGSDHGGKGGIDSGEDGGTGEGRDGNV